MMHEFISNLPYFVIGAAVLWAAFKIGIPREKKAIKDWAASNGYLLLKSEKRFLREGPFTWMPIREVLSQILL